MSEELKQDLANWLRQSPSVRGALVRGIRFADETFVSDFDSRDFSAGAMEQAWRSVADTFQVLAAQQIPAARLTWVYERAVLHCARRDDGAILGIFVSKRQPDADVEGVDRMLAEFRSFPGA